MHSNLKFLTYALLTFLFATQFTSCSKDSDLLSEYVINEELDALNRLVINDDFTVAPGETALLDVLSNDQFDNLENVSITGTSEPENGTVVVNSDNTLTYTSTAPETASEDVPDTFTYSVEETTATGETISENGTVYINLANRAPVVNFSEYGAIGNGIKDDTAALQAALDGEVNLTADVNSIFKISRSLNLKKSGDQIVNFNGATVIFEGSDRDVIFLDKSNGVAKIENLNIDANLKGQWGIYIKSSYILDNVHVKDTYSNTGSSIGMYVSCTDTVNWTIGEINNSSSKNIRGINNGTIGDALGASRCIQISVNKNVGISFNIKDSEFERATGEDGDVLFWQVTGFNNTGTDTKLIVNNSTFAYGTRRVAKFQGSEVYLYDSTFTGIDLSDPDMAFMRETGGFISLQSGTIGYDGYYLGGNFVFDGCTFNGSNFDKRIISWEFTKDIVFNDCNFNNGTEIRMWRGGGAMCVTNNTFTPGSRVYDINDKPPYVWLGPMNVSGNKGTDASFDEYTDARPPNLTNYECVNYTKP